MENVQKNNLKQDNIYFRYFTTESCLEYRAY
jgi:hypothetical protein